MNRQRIAALAQKEGREILRDRTLCLLAFAIPAVLMVVLGYGLSLDITRIPLVIVDDDRSQMSRDYVNRFITSPNFDFKGYVDRLEDIDPLIADNKVRIALVIPAHFQGRLRAGWSVSVQALIDGTFPSRAQITKAYVLAITEDISGESWARHLAQQRGLSFEEARVLVQPVGLELRYLYKQSLKSGRSGAPATLFCVIVLCSPLLVALRLAREKEIDSLVNIYASAITGAEFLIGTLLPYIAVSASNLMVLWFLAAYLFQAPFRGGFALFYIASLIYLVWATGIGILVSLLVSTPLAILLITLVIAIVPATLYSGMFIPIPSLPPYAQALAQLLPGVHFHDIVQASFLKGIGLPALWLDVVALGLCSAAVLGAAWLVFRKMPKG